MSLRNVYREVELPRSTWAVTRKLKTHSADNKPSDELKKCLQRSGVASFHLGRYK